jgi:predicted heme/steroid binding protein
MTNTFTKGIFAVTVYLFIVIFAGIGVANLFDKSILDKTVKTITTRLTEEDEASEEAPVAAVVTPPVTSSGSASGSQAKTPAASTGTAVTAPPAAAPTKTTLTASVVSQHNTSSNCWIIISGTVYNLSSYRHSGGTGHISCGTDQTAALSSRHSLSYVSFFTAVGTLGSQI